MQENRRLAFLIVAVIAALFVQREFIDTGAEEVMTTSGEMVTIGLLDDLALAIDEPAPDFALTNLDGETVRLSDFRGKTVVLNFWASWCPPCREEMPEFQELWDERGEDGSDDLVMLALDFLVQDTMADARGFVEGRGFTFPVLFDTADGSVADRYRVRGLPATFFIDSEAWCAPSTTAPCSATCCRTVWRRRTPPAEASPASSRVRDATPQLDRCTPPVPRALRARLRGAHRGCLRRRRH